MRKQASTMSFISLIESYGVHNTFMENSIYDHFIDNDQFAKLIQNPTIYTATTYKKLFDIPMESLIQSFDSFTNCIKFFIILYLYIIILC